MRMIRDTSKYKKVLPKIHCPFCHCWAELKNSEQGKDFMAAHAWCQQKTGE